MASSNSLGGLNLGRVHLERRTTEGSRSIQENFNSVIEELRPLVQQARSVNGHGLSFSHWLRSSRLSERQENLPSETSSNSIVITLENEQEGVVDPNISHIHEHGSNISNSVAADNYLNILTETVAARRSEQNNPNNNNNNNIDDPFMRQSPESQALMSVLQKYIPFVLIPFAKSLYDHRARILNFIALLATFMYTNSVVIREIGKQSRRSVTFLLMVVANLLACILFIYYIFQDQNLYMSLVFIPPYTQPLSFWDLLWIVGVTDFVLKLITVILKVFVTILPGKILPYQKRGKWYLFLEASSQLYRSLAPIQSWLYYLLESYQGPEKVVGVFLSAAYMVSKGRDLMSKVKLFRGAFWKLLHNVNLGVSPSKEQLLTAGNQCAICHEEYETPVLLQCRHIFCEGCVATWFDREPTCPLCRAKVVDDPSWRDGATSYFIQLF